MNEPKAVTRHLAPRYQKARKKDRNSILNEFSSLTGYNGSYAAFVLRNWGRKRILTIRGIRTIYVFGQKHGRKSYKRHHIYDYHPFAIEVSLGPFWRSVWQTTSFFHSHHTSCS